MQISHCLSSKMEHRLHAHSDEHAQYFFDPSLSNAANVLLFSSPTPKAIYSTPKRQSCHTSSPPHQHWHSLVSTPNTSADPWRHLLHCNNRNPCPLLPPVCAPQEERLLSNETDLPREVLWLLELVIRVENRKKLEGLFQSDKHYQRKGTSNRRPYSV